MSAIHATFANQMITIEPIQDGSNLTITCPVNETGYMTNLQEQIQAWQPQATNSQGETVPVSTHAELNNSQVILEMTAKSGALTYIQLQSMAEQLGSYLNSRTERAMSASASDGMTGGAALRGDVETRGA